MCCAFCMPPFFSMPCLFICTSEYRIVYAMSFPSTWKWFWKCQSCLLYSVITCLLFDFIISSAIGKILGEAKHLSGACQLMICSGNKIKSPSLQTKVLSASNKWCEFIEWFTSYVQHFSGDSHNVSSKSIICCVIPEYVRFGLFREHWSFWGQFILSLQTNNLAPAL